MTGLKVQEVNVYIQKVVKEDAKKEAELPKIAEAKEVK
mgnify:FL=1